MCGSHISQHMCVMERQNCMEYFFDETNDQKNKFENIIESKIGVKRQREDN